MNVSSVKNLNGEVFSAVQDASLTNVVQTNSGNWQDITAYQSNSASYLTAHQDLSDYYTTADANTLSSMLSGAIDYVSANAGDEFPISADEAIQYVQTNSAQIDETVTSFQTNSSTYMVEPNLEYNAVNEISGYNGSAIAQYGAEKQWLVHDDTLVHAANSAQYALGCNISALQRLMGIDETVLYSANTGVTAFTASEPLTNFKEVVFYVAPNSNDTTVSKITLPMTGHNTETIALTYHSTWNGFKGGIQISTEYTNTGMSAFQLISGAWFGWAGNTVNTGTYYEACIYKIIGIGRKQ